MRLRNIRTAYLKVQFIHFLVTQVTLHRILLNLVCTYHYQLSSQNSYWFPLTPVPLYSILLTRLRFDIGFSVAKYRQASLPRRNSLFTIVYRCIFRAANIFLLYFNSISQQRKGIARTISIYLNLLGRIVYRRATYSIYQVVFAYRIAFRFLRPSYLSNLSYVLSLAV